MMNAASLPASLAIVSADRPSQALECLKGYLQDRPAPSGVLLADDSRDPSNAALTFEALRQADLSTPAPVRYLNAHDRYIFASRLAGLGIPGPVARFCLLGLPGMWFTAGANRNAALLDTVNQKLLMVDDDTTGRTAAYGPLRSDQIQLGGHDDPTHIRFFACRADAVRAAHWCRFDIFGDTARGLGTGLPGLSARRDDSCDHLLRLADCGIGDIRIIGFGTVGDSGFYSPVHLLWMASPKTCQQFYGSDSIMRTALTSREVLRIAPRPTITHATVCMATVIGLDNSAQLPPFLPVGRNEDGFFGNLLLRCIPEACTLHVPFGILHQAPENRPYHRLFNEPQTLRLSELLILLMAAYTIPPGTNFQRACHLLGTHLCELARSPVNFAGFAHETVKSARTSLASRINEYIARSYPLPSHWNENLRMFIASVGTLVESPDNWHPSEFENCSPYDLLPEVCRIVRLTGEMLQTWPAILEATRYLQSKHIAISRLME